RLLVNAPGQAAAFHQPHGVVVLALVLVDLEDGDDAGVVQLGRRPGLLVEALDVGLGGELAGPDHLQRHVAAQVAVPGAGDAAQAAGGDPAEHLVIAEGAEDAGRVRGPRAGRSGAGGRGERYRVRGASVPIPLRVGLAVRGGPATRGVRRAGRRLVR